MTADCFLCAIAVGTVNLPWHDRPLWLDPRAGFVVPGLGGFTPGYVLVAPMAHHRSLRQAVAAQGESFARFLAEVMAYLEECLGPLTFWEHGTELARDLPRSACIDHAHLHVVAGDLDLPEPPNANRYAGLRDALLHGSAARAGRDYGYLLLGWSKGAVLAGRDVRISQYYRREWARLANRADEWDYLSAEDPLVTSATIKLVFSGAGRLDAAGPAAIR